MNMYNDEQNLYHYTSRKERRTMPHRRNPSIRSLPAPRDRCRR